MRYATTIVLSGFAAAPALAASGSVSVTIPRLPVAEYHKPYVAIWLEQPGQPARTVAVWYSPKGEAREPGTKWLADIRTWWRKGGRSLALPADGISGATRGPGVHKVALPLNGLAPGAYTLNVEAAREVGGRELVSLPFTLPARGGQSRRAAGRTELGAVALDIKP